jgi:very-short-patch-repair endonuclease
MAALAGGQHGVVGHRQLLDLGLGREAVQYRIKIGRLLPLYRGVYALGHNSLSVEGRWLAAVLACGPDAVLSHRSAAALWRIRPTSRPAIDVSAERTRRGQPGITLHRVRSLNPDDRTIRRAIPVTSISRTLLDLAEVLRPRELEKAFEDADRLELLDLHAVERLRARSRGRRGLEALGALVTDYRGPPPMTRSRLERAFHWVIRDAGLPPASTNRFVEGFEVDVAWPERRLVVELDGRGYHSHRAAFETDRVRDARLQVGGYRVLRVTEARLKREPQKIIEEVRSLLG